MLLALFLSGCALQPFAREVELRSLVESPQQYEGKLLVVHGFLDFGREGDAICSDVRDGANVFCVEIERSDTFLRQRSEHYGHRVSFVAQFVAVPKSADPESQCPAQLGCVQIGLPPPFRLRMISAIHIASS
jgi:hypothetical protein